MQHIGKLLDKLEKVECLVLIQTIYPEETVKSPLKKEDTLYVKSKKNSLMKAEAAGCGKGGNPLKEATDFELKSKIEHNRIVKVLGCRSLLKG